MRRTFIFAMVFALLSTTIVSAASPKASARGNLNTRPATASPWLPGADPGPVTYETLKSKVDEKGMPYFALINQSEGAVWMWRQIDGNASAAVASFQIRDMDGCENALPIIYIGSDIPKYLYQFSTVGKGVTKNWGSLYYETPLKKDAGTLYIAIGYVVPATGGLYPHTAGLSNVVVKLAK